MRQIACALPRQPNKCTQQVPLGRCNDVMPIVISCLEASVAIDNVLQQYVKLTSYVAYQNSLEQSCILKNFAQGRRNNNAATSNKQCLHVLAANLGDLNTHVHSLCA